jgi:hypothetical protein
MEIKLSSTLRVPVRLLDLTGTSVTGVTSASISATIINSSGFYTKSLGPGDWFEIDSTYAPGLYDLTLSSSDTNNIGFLRYYVSQSVSNYAGLLEVVPYTATDIMNALLGITGSGSGTIIGKPHVTVSEDIDQIGKIVQDIQIKMDDIL